MQLDPQDLRLGQDQAQASLRAAETNCDLARGRLKRYQDLRGQNFVSQAVLDQKVAAAQAGPGQRRGGARRARASRPTRPATPAWWPMPTAWSPPSMPKSGQVVQAGTPVVRVARTDEKEVVIGVPEDQVDAAAPGRRRARCACGPTRTAASPARSAKWRRWPIRPPAPTPSRSRSRPRDDVRLGMTAVVQLAQHADAAAGASRVPLSALVPGQGRQPRSGWSRTAPCARLQPVQVGGVAGNDVLLAGGVQARPDGRHRRRQPAQAGPEGQGAGRRRGAPRRCRGRACAPGGRSRK